jgi:uncharacterized iron-regulated membrane protein
LRAASWPAPQLKRLTADELLAKARSANPDLAPKTIVLRSDRSAPASLAAGPARQLFVNPYSGDVLGEGNGRRVREFFRTLVEWHRYVAMAGDSRPTGRAITGASNLMFLFIVVSGLFLWWPRTWTWAALGNIVWFRGGLPGKARDFNWHNTIRRDAEGRIRIPTPVVNFAHEICARGGLSRSGGSHDHQRSTAV